MPEFNVEVVFDVYCSKCGAALCNNCSTQDYSVERDEAFP